ncbi:hypothetical protein [Actinomadura formosensis]|uniref:hypothetical protein n=1 Tax=Actinomadura formosensis TaxID=60706 RepID=UPI0008369CDB|nr:hypothetical protein [Actinomadura formosensis]
MSKLIPPDLQGIGLRVITEPWGTDRPPSWFFGDIQEQSTFGIELKTSVAGDASFSGLFQLRYCFCGEDETDVKHRHIYIPWRRILLVEPDEVMFGWSCKPLQHPKTFPLCDC